MKKTLIQIVIFVGIFFLRLEGAMNQSSDLFEFSENEVFVPSRLGDLKLYKDNEGFHILKDGSIYDIQNCFCDKILRGISNERLASFLGRNKPKVIIMTPEEFNKLDYTDIREITGTEKDELLSKLFGGGYISVHQMSDGEYALEAKIRLPGGWSWERFRQCCLYVAAGVAIGAVIGAGFGIGVAAIVVAKAAAATAAAATATATATGITGGAVFLAGGVTGGSLGVVSGGVIGGMLMPKETPEKHDEENPQANNQYLIPINIEGRPGSADKNVNKSISKKICPPNFFKKKKGSEILEEERKKRLRS